MFRFLIVEDNEDLLEELSHGFSRWFPDSKIETAVAVEEGIHLIRDANSSGWFYDAAVLDFKLPRQQGGQDEVDETLCREIKNIGFNTLIIHITGYVDDGKVLKHVKDFHQAPGDPGPVLLDKVNVEWFDKLKKTVKAYLYGSLLEERMNKLLGPNDQGSITLDLANLFREIIIYWDDLDEKLRRRILETFNVDATSRPIRISLLM